MEEILERISSVSSKYGFELCDHRSIHKPYLLDKNNKIVDSFCKICEEITGEAKPPYLLSGGTYAHELPNAYVFGSSSNFKPESWPKGRGGAHGIDEAVSLDRL
jgi:acetylornithine deacetylase/succinyl-diaminopimelate desuccinylase-like protein